MKPHFHHPFPTECYIAGGFQIRSVPPIVWSTNPLLPPIVRTRINSHVRVAAVGCYGCFAGCGLFLCVGRGGGAEAFGYPSWLVGRAERNGCSGGKKKRGKGRYLQHLVC
jgi:hypothetical protein